jgi:hypothetical protein
MKQYVIVTKNEDGGLEVVADGDTREAAMAKLGKVAEVGKVYQEMKVIGSPIEPKDRGVVLSRVK